MIIQVPHLSGNFSPKGGTTCARRNYLREAEQPAQGGTTCASLFKKTTGLKDIMKHILFLSLWAAAVTAQTGTVITNSIDMKLVLLPAGTFTMGSNPDDILHQADEILHTVIISKPFYISLTEVTQQQWRCLGFNDKSFFKGDSLPVEKVSWQEAVAFCQKLSQKEGKTYRLPTEAEWEYACCAGSGQASEALADHAWFYDNSDEQTHPIAQKKANNWGLFDMLGNVAEWCADYYAAEYPAIASDPQGPATGTYRVMRGGSWSSFAPACRCAGRSDAPPAYQLKQTGFRIVLQ